ncbi:MAG: HD domain-containing protein [Candidatus Kuenenbacteria bacterium]
MTNKIKIINKLEKQIISLFHSEGSGHDIYHLKRVFNLALQIQKKEGGDKLVIGVASFLHDIHRIIQKETGKFCSPKSSLPTIKEILEKVRLPKNKIEKILHCIQFHEEYDFSEKGKTVEDIETLIVQDADNLDAIGAIGIGRTFTFGGNSARPMWIPELFFDRKIFDESELDPSTIHHFYSKLLKLKNNMNTQTARKMALQRHKFMKIFLDEFFKEWKGEK